VSMRGVWTGRQRRAKRFRMLRWLGFSARSGIKQPVWGLPQR